ncbi:hypothetical protein, conserved [Eimeria brunetti]|uniref:Uncharacterized protein n=1 Tax=Eimeria brunetti TaxID=51314 RepID=U6LT50_9EIME|nr:hypothetical protein, conserved [Eimeria brunetti]
MFWWRHTGGTPSEGSPSECSPTGERGLSPAPFAWPTDEEEARSVTGRQIIERVGGARGVVPETPRETPLRASADWPPGGSVRRCLTSSPRRGRSCLRTPSLSLHSLDSGKLCREGTDIAYSTGPRSSFTGSECLSLKSEEYLSACSDVFGTPTSSEGKEMSFVTGTASPESDPGSAMGSLPPGLVSSDSCMRTIAPRVAENGEGRLQSAPESLLAASVRAAYASVRSLSLPLLGPPASTTTTSGAAGAPLTHFRWIRRKPSSSGKGNDGQTPLHVQMKALASQTPLDPSRSASGDSLNPDSLHSASRSSSRGEIPRAHGEHVPDLVGDGFSHYGHSVAPDAGVADEQGGLRSPCELGASEKRRCAPKLVGKFVTPHGPSGAPELPVAGFLSHDQERRATDWNKLNALQSEAGISWGLWRSKTVQSCTLAVDVFGPSDCKRRSRSWSMRSAGSFLDRLLPAFNSAGPLPGRLMSCPRAAEPIQHDVSNWQSGELETPAQDNCGEALRAGPRRNNDAMNPDTLGEHTNFGTPSGADSMESSPDVCNGDGIYVNSSIDSDGNYSCRDSGSGGGSRCSSNSSSSYSSSSKSICSQKSGSMYSLCSMSADSSSPTTTRESGEAHLLVGLDNHFSDAASAGPSHSQEAVGESSNCRVAAVEGPKSTAGASQLPATGRGGTKFGQASEAGRQEMLGVEHARAHLLPEQELKGQGGTHETDTLQLHDQRGFSTAQSDPCDDNVQACSPSHSKAHTEGSQISATCARPFASEPCSTAVGTGVGEATAAVSQQPVPELARGHGGDSLHQSEEFKAGAVAPDQKCDEVKTVNGLTAEQSLQHSCVGTAAGFQPAIFPDKPQRGEAELIACTHCEEGQGEPVLHDVHLHEAPTGLGAPLISTSSAPETEASYTATRSPNTVYATPEDPEKPVSAVRLDNEGRSSQEPQATQGASPDSMARSGASLSTLLASVSEVTKADESVKYASNGSVEELEEPKRQHLPWRHAGAPGEPVRFPVQHSVAG